MYISSSEKKTFPSLSLHRYIAVGIACAGATSSGNGSSSSTYGVGLTGGSWLAEARDAGHRVRGLFQSCKMVVFSWGTMIKKNDKPSIWANDHNSLS